MEEDLDNSFHHKKDTVSAEERKIGELLESIRTNLRIRSYISIFFISSFLILYTVFHFDIPPLLFVLLGLLFLLSLIYYFVFLQFPLFGRFRSLVTASTVITSVDLVLLGSILFYIGGFMFGGLLFFPLYIIYTYLIHPLKWHNRVILATAIVFFVSTVLLEAFKIIEPQRIVPLTSDTYQNPSFVATYIVVVVGLLIFIAKYSSIFSDELREKTKALEIDKNQLNAVFTRLPEGVIVFDRHGHFLSCNADAEYLLGISKKKIAGRTAQDLEKEKSVNKEVLKLVIVWLQKGFKKPQILEINNPHRIFKVSGVEIDKSSIGHLASSLLFFYNVTREEMISRMKSEFISIAAHQLRTPLSSYKWALNLLLQREYGPLTDEQKRILEKNYIENERLIQMISDLLNVVHIEEGTYGFKFIVGDIRPLIDEIVLVYKKKADELGITLSKGLYPEPFPKLRFDKGMIRMIFENFLDNALIYNKKNGRIEINTEVVSGRVIFSFKDTGMGIPVDDMDRLFTKFFRSKNAVGKDTGGYGLGLYLSRNIAHNHGGEIEAQSVENKGSTFSLILPIPEKYN